MAALFGSVVATHLMSELCVDHEQEHRQPTQDSDVMTQRFLLRSRA